MAGKSRKDKTAAAPDDREARLKAALKANLARRKKQAKSRKTDGGKE
jgi:thioredoxin-like negative regulator of GroEL